VGAFMDASTFAYFIGTAPASMVLLGVTASGVSCLPTRTRYGSRACGRTRVSVYVNGARISEHNACVQ
jgi:hypothetical protein